MKPAHENNPMPPGDDLWNILGKATPMETPPWLAAKSLARMRRKSASGFPWKTSLRWMLGSSVCVLLTLGLLVLRDQQQETALTQQRLETEKMVAALDYLWDESLSAEDLWNDSIQ
jgi:hypothetical protein